MTEFEEKLRQQHEDSMHRELEALLTTTNKAEAEISRKDFDGFKKLFHRFLQVKGPSVDWAKISRPPEELHVFILSSFSHPNWSQQMALPLPSLVLPEVSSC